MEYPEVTENMVENIVRQWTKDYGYPNEAVRKYGHGEPTLVIIGENHYSRRCKREQGDLLQRLQPERVFHEAWANYVYNRERRTIERDTTYPIPIEVQRFIAERRKYALDIADPQMRRIFYRTKFGKWTHRERISHGIDRYDLSEVHIPIFKYPGVYNDMLLNRLPTSVRYVIGSDLPRGEVNYLMSMLKREYEPKQPSSKMQKTPEEESLFLTREARMSNIFIQYRNENLHVAVQGSSHIREADEYGCVSQSRIHDVLQSNGVSYICLDQLKHPESERDIAFETKMAGAYFWINKHQTLLELRLESGVERVKRFFGSNE